MRKKYIIIWLTVFFLTLFFFNCASNNSLNTLSQRADRGDVEAQLEMAKMYERGSRVVRDNVEAAILYRKAAEQGNVEAQYHLG